MKKFFTIFGGLMIGLSLLSAPAHAEGLLYYCAEMNTTCETYNFSLEDFLNDLPGSFSANEPRSFEATDEYIYFEEGSFNVYVNRELIEALLINNEEYTTTLSQYGGYFSYATILDWNAIDGNSNKIPDMVEEYIEHAEDVSDRLENRYYLDAFWDYNDKLNISFIYGNTGYNGMFSPDGILYLNPIQNDPYGEVTDSFKDTVTHELAHAFQYSYFPYATAFGNTFAEGIATMIQSKIQNNSETYLERLDYSSLQYPELSIFGDVADRFAEGSEGHSVANYGGFLWYTYLYENFYGKRIIARLYESYGEYANSNLASYPEYLSYFASLTALDEIGIDITDAYIDFARWNYDKRQYTNGDSMGIVYYMEEHYSFPVTKLADEEAPALFGTNYIKLDLEDETQEYLKVTFTANLDAKYNVQILPSNYQYSRTIGQVNEVTDEQARIFNVDFGGETTAYFPLDEITTDEAVMIVSVIDVSEITDPNDDYFGTYVYPYTYEIEAIDEKEYPGQNIISNSPTYSGNFTDVADSNPNKDAIEYLYTNGIVNGYDDGTFKPNNTVNRAELLKILVEGQGITPDETTYKECFPDVNEQWFAKYVCYALEEGWVAGYPDGNFRPSQTVNKVEAIKMLINSQGIELNEVSTKPFDDVDADSWFAPYITKAKELGILEETGSIFSPSGEMARGGITENLYRLLTR